MSAYVDALTQAMAEIGKRDDAVFLGQAVAYPGTAMTQTFSGVLREKLIEMPVAEDMQMGVATGLALAGALPVCVYPRFNFLLLAINQLVLHLDKLPMMADGCWPRVLIRTAIATADPLDPGPQHLGDFIWPMRRMLRTIVVVDLDGADVVLPAYRRAVEYEGATLLVERSALYNT